MVQKYEPGAAEVCKFGCGYFGGDNDARNRFKGDSKHRNLKDVGVRILSMIISKKTIMISGLPVNPELRISPS